MALWKARIIPKTHKFAYRRVQLRAVRPQRARAYLRGVWLVCHTSYTRVLYTFSKRGLCAPRSTAHTQG